MSLTSDARLLGEKVLEGKLPPAIAWGQDDHSCVRNGIPCAGVHLIFDLYGAKVSRLSDFGHVEETLRRCVEASNATLLHLHVHPFEGGGISGVAVLAESHISIHTWPERAFAALDVFMCGVANPDACGPVLKEAFLPERLETQEILRGIK